MTNPVFAALAQAASQNEPVTLGIISGVKGSSPQKVGAKALFYADGRIRGTMGGGCLEAEIQQRAIQALRTGKPETFDLLLDHDFGWDDGLICGGKVFGLILPNAQSAGAAFWEKLAARKSPIAWGVMQDFSLRLASFADSENESWQYFETVTPPCPFWIAGAGHIAQAVAPLAAQLDFKVTVFDDRPALLNRDYFGDEIELRTDSWDNLLNQHIDASGTEGASGAFALVVTRGHRHDALVLKHWVQEPFLFIGMIGSARKARTIFEHFLEEKLATPEQLERVACPVGIKIRSESVPEIAVSIMAQFIEKRAELVYRRHVAGPAKQELVSAASGSH
jgi:xanthine dehydrogenase accessory factor